MSTSQDAAALDDLRKRLRAIVSEAKRKQADGIARMAQEAIAASFHKGEHEPRFVIMAHDPYALPTIDVWVAHWKALRNPKVGLAVSTRNAIADWQRDNPNLLRDPD